MMISIDLINEGYILLTIVGYISGETTNTYSFFISIDNDEIFYNTILDPVVYLIDSSTSMAATIATRAIGTAKHQLYN